MPPKKKQKISFEIPEFSEKNSSSNSSTTLLTFFDDYAYNEASEEALMRDPIFRSSSRRENSSELIKQKALALKDRIKQLKLASECSDAALDMVKRIEQDLLTAIKELNEIEELSSLMLESASSSYQPDIITTLGDLESHTNM